MLQTDPKKSLALTLLLALSGRAPRTAIGVSRYPLLVEKLLQFQLENSRAQNLAGEEGESDNQQHTLASHCVDSP